MVELQGLIVWLSVQVIKFNVESPASSTCRWGKSSKFSLKYGLNLTIPYHKLSYHPNTLDCVSTIFLPWTK